MAGKNTQILPFSASSAGTWFDMMEAAWATQDNITDNAKYRMLITNLPIEIGTELREFLSDPPADDKYEHLKREILRIVAKPLNTCLAELESVGLDGRRPSQLWAHLRTLNREAGSPYSDAMLRRRFSQLLPLPIQMCLCAAEHQPADEYARMADSLQDHQKQNLVGVAHIDTKVPAPEPPRQEPSIAAVAERPSTSQRLDTMSDRLTKLEEAIRNLTLSSAAPRYRPTYSQAHRHEDTADHHQQDLRPRLCYYHDSFGDRAFRCRPPCSWRRTQPRAQDTEVTDNQAAPSGNDAWGGRY